MQITTINYERIQKSVHLTSESKKELLSAEFAAESACGKEILINNPDGRLSNNVFKVLMQSGFSVSLHKASKNFIDEHLPKSPSENSEIKHRKVKDTHISKSNPVKYAHGVSNPFGGCKGRNCANPTTQFMR